MNMKPKLSIRKCKMCGEKFTQLRLLQFVCSPKCGSDYGKMLTEKKVVQDKKNFKESVKTKVYAKEYKADLQREINKLARIVDAKFGYETCIDCDKGFGAQTDAAHFHDIGGNSSLRFNLHNIHSANSQCNKYSSNHHSGYEKGLKARYGEEYYNYVNTDIVLKFPRIKLSEDEVFEKLKLVRTLIRTFDTYQFTSAVNARSLLNELIGIYKN